MKTIYHRKKRTGVCHHSHELLVVIAVIGMLIAILLPIIAALKKGVSTGAGWGEMLYTLGNGILGGLVTIVAFVLFFVILTAMMLAYECVKTKGFRGTLEFCRKRLKYLIFRR